MSSELTAIHNWLVKNPDSSAVQISQATGIEEHLLYPCLADLEHSRTVSSYWDTPVPHADGELRRQLYRIADIEVINATKPMEG